MTDDTDCQRFNYNVKMNGGIKQVDGTTYIVNICGSGRHGSGFFADQNRRSGCSRIDVGHSAVFRFLGRAAGLRADHVP
ncbi:hypothetical protein [Burkholderia arboris]|nr:hypothetical protein [Burkholderia arboris]MCA8493956.1 hypothetical protein [Burkholderia arboris]